MMEIFLQQARREASIHVKIEITHLQNQLQIREASVLMGLTAKGEILERSIRV